MNASTQADGKHLHGLILAGGEGRRLQLYVQQRNKIALPKQYVNLIGQSSVLDDTFRRVEKLIRTEHIFTVVNRGHLEHPEVRRQLAARASETIIVQPANKETGPGILLPLIYLCRQCPEAIVAVFPSDHYIVEEDRFMRAVERAAEVVAHNPARIVLLAVAPRHAETEYGYIVPQKQAEVARRFGTQEISAFIEKPDLAQARRLVRTGALWNTMTMVFKVGTLLQLVDRVHPVLCRKFRCIFDAIGTTEEQQSIERLYQYLEPINFSREIIKRIAERSPRSILVFPVSEVFWSDLGSADRVLQVLNRLRKSDDLLIPSWPEPVPPGPRSQSHRPTLQS